MSESGPLDPERIVDSAGLLGVAFRPAGTEGYEHLARGAIRFEIFGVPLLAANLADIIRSKEAADRPQSRQDVVVLRAMLRRRGSNPGSS